MLRLSLTPLPLQVIPTETTETMIVTEMIDLNVGTETDIETAPAIAIVIESAEIAAENTDVIATLLKTT
jgi:hypothetical protein